jgi:GNAT superfamily N-acetyltransferase
MSDVAIRAVDPLDPNQAEVFKGWVEVHNAAGRAIWGDAAQQTTPTDVRAAYRTSDQRQTAWAAVDAYGRLVGAVALIEPLRENLDTAGIWLSVHPDSWRRRIGSRLLAHVEDAARAAGRSRIHEHSGAPTQTGDAPTAFALASGYRQVLLDLRSELSLPLPTDRLADLAALAWEATDPAYVIETAWDELPETWLEDQALMARRMSTDAPMGDIDLDEQDWDGDRVRDQWTRGRAAGRRALDSVARHVESGRLVAYSDLVVMAGQPDLAIQSDTLVLKEHRGHRLGLAVKLANVRALQDELPAVSTVRTWNAESNTHMLAVNQAMGFFVTGYTREWTKALS